MEGTPLTALDYLCQQAEIERPKGFTRRRGARISAAVSESLDNGLTAEETHEIAMRSVSGFLFVLLGRAVLSALVSWIISRIMAGRAMGAIKDGD